MGGSQLWNLHQLPRLIRTGAKHYVSATPLHTQTQTHNTHTYDQTTHTCANKPRYNTDTALMHWCNHIVLCMWHFTSLLIYIWTSSQFINDPKNNMYFLSPHKACVHLSFDKFIAFKKLLLSTKTVHQYFMWCYKANRHNVEIKQNCKQSLWSMFGLVPQCPCHSAPCQCQYSCSMARYVVSDINIIQ